MISDKKKIQTLLIDILYAIVGSILYSIGIYIFAKNANFAPGGVTGISMMLNHLFGLPIGAMTLILNIPLALTCYKYLGKHFVSSTIITMVILSVILDGIFPLLPKYTGSPLLACLYAGLFAGAGLALFYMRGSSSGGIDFIVMTVRTVKPHLSIGSITMCIDLFIIMLGWPVFGNIDAVLYGLIYTFVASTAVDKIMYGMSSSKIAIIITTKGPDVAQQISSKINRGSTLLKGLGTYSHLDKDVLMCACSSSQAYSIKKSVNEIDPKAFIMLTSTNEIFGEGFLKG